MRRAIALLVLVLATAAAPAQAAPELPLSHDGRWITDAKGRVVMLHGVNMVYKRPPYTPGAPGFGPDDARFLAREGYNSVRLGIIYKAVEPRPGEYNDRYLGRIARTVRILGREGITSTLDFHQDLYNERFEGEGWPDWAVQDDGLPAEPKNGFPANYLTMPALNRAFDHFWANDPGPEGVGLQDRYAAAWRHVAARFARNPNVMGYDLLNEPWPGSAYPSCTQPEGCPAFDAQLAEFSRRVITAIREVDPDTLILYEPNVLFNNGIPTHLGDLGDDHLAMSFHDYCLVAGQQEVCDQRDEMVFQFASDQAAATGDSLLLTEFGATRDPTVLGPMTDRADRFMVGWQVWHYCGCDDPTTSGPGDTQALVYDPAKPPRGDNLDTAKLRFLSRPYPQLIAGRPLSWSFTDGVFTFKWRPRHRGRAEVVVPRRAFPKGFGIEVKHAKARFDRARRLLILRANRGAKRAAVTLEPGARA